MVGANTRPSLSVLIIAPGYHVIMIHVLSSHWYYLPRVDLQPRSQARTTRSSGPPPEVLNGGMPRAMRRASTRAAKSNGAGYDEDSELAEALSLSLSQENDRKRREQEEARLKAAVARKSPLPKKKSRLKLQKPPAAAEAARPDAAEPAPTASKKRALPDGVGASSSCHATRSVHCQLPYSKVRLATGGGRGAAAAADRSGGSSVTILHRQGCTDRTSE